ncbi:MAG: membrane lipoprotein lipid attachment site-containing protein [Carnobacterium sp.]|nr:membrane lipoprotein lipid attachment site-containing protein [Carnobacterium sp.]
MKKLMAALGIVFILSGCSPSIESNLDSLNNSKSSPTSLSSSAETISSITESKQLNSDNQKSFLNKDGVEAIDDSENKNPDTSEIFINDIELVPQKADLENGFTVENDPVLQGIEERMRQSEKIGLPNDVAIHFTGMVLNENDKMQAIFILVNLTDVRMKNINMTISFSNTMNEVILDKSPFFLSEDRFGIFELNTAMPIYIEIPEESRIIFNNLKEFDEMQYSIDSFDYEEIN